MLSRSRVRGARALTEGKTEYPGRRAPHATLLPADAAAATVAEKIRAALAR